MNAELLAIALMAGAANWAFRYLPTRASGAGAASGGAARGVAGRFLSATGPAAITTLFVASVLPALLPDVQAPLPLATGVGAVLVVFAARRSVAGATIAGAVVYGAVTAFLGG